MISTPTPSEPPQDETEPRFDSQHRAEELFAQLPEENLRQLRWQAQRLEFQLASPIADRDDHHQDLVLDLLKRLPKFDDRRAGLRTYSSRVIDSSSSHLKHHYRAAKRAGKAMPLTAHHDGGDRRRPQSRDTTCWELAADSQACLDQLSPLQQRLCHYLGDKSEREIACQLGITRHTVRAEIQKIRRCFIRNEMRAYL